MVNQFHDELNNPGSYIEFLERTGLEHGEEALELLAEELVEHRRMLVVNRGLDTLEQLHAAPASVSPERAQPVGSVALAG